jgi:DNA primase
MLKQTLTTDTASDKIKFLNEVSKILSKVDNDIEKEIYIEKIAKEYNVSKEAIYAQTNKLQYSNSVGEKILERKVTPKVVKQETTEVSDGIIRRENMVISILLTEGNNAYNQIKDIVRIENLKYEKNKEILKKLYAEFEKGNSNISSVLDTLNNEEQLNHITRIMADDYNIQDMQKAILDIINIYEKEKIIARRNEILSSLENKDLTKEEKVSLENELSNIIIKLAKFK